MFTSNTYQATFVTHCKIKASFRTDRGGQTDVEVEIVREIFHALEIIFKAVWKFPLLIHVSFSSKFHVIPAKSIFMGGLQMDVQKFDIQILNMNLYDLLVYLSFLMD